MFKKEKNSLNDLLLVTLITFVPFLVWFNLFSFKLIGQPFIMDDLHFIRVYPFEELIGSWSNNWVLNNVETPSYRPTAVMFYNFLGSLFLENTYLIRLFIFFMMFLLILFTNIMLVKVGFGFFGLVIFSSLITFSKIYTALVSWMTLSALIFCYIFAILSIICFLLWLEKKNKKYYLLSFLFAFIAIFCREELYTLPAFLFVISFCLKNKPKINTFNLIISCLPFAFVVILHIVLREIFVVEASQIGFSLDSIKFGSEDVSFGNLIKAFKASWFPMGYISIKDANLKNSLIYITWIVWIISVALSAIIYILFKDSRYISSKKILLFFFLAIILCSSNLAVARSFGIFLPSIFTFSIIAVFVLSLVKIGFHTRYNFFIKTLSKFLILSILISGLVGGYVRSNEHTYSMNLFSEYVVTWDSTFVYDYYEQGIDVNIPKNRLEKKRNHLRKLNITTKIDINKPFSYYSDKIFYPVFHPEDF